MTPPGSALRALGRWLDPFRRYAAVRCAGVGPPSATFTGVYAAAHADTLGVLAAEARQAGWQVRLWALDEVCLPDTVGVGRGSRGTNFNRLRRDAATDAWLIQCDDDVRMRPGDLARWLTLSALLRYEVSQPGHGPGSHAAHPIVTGSRRQLARDTTFVEMGPLLGISPRAQPLLPPLPERGFGWGWDIHTHDLLSRGLRLGIVDATPMWHLRPPAAGYEVAVEEANQREVFAARGLGGWEDIQDVVRVRRLV